MNSAHWTTFARNAGPAHQLGRSARHLLLLLATGVDWATGENRWTTATVMEQLGCGRSAYHDALRELVGHGLVEHRRAAPGRRASWRLDDGADALLCRRCNVSDVIDVFGSAEAEPNGSGDADPSDSTVAADRTNASGWSDSTVAADRTNASGWSEPVSVAPQSEVQLGAQHPENLPLKPPSATEAFEAQHPRTGGLKPREAKAFADQHFDGDATALYGAMLYGDDLAIVTGYVEARQSDAQAVVA